VRVSAWNGSQTLILSHSYYYDQFITNKEIVDVPLEIIVKGTSAVVPPMLLRSSLRELNMRDGRLLSFEESPLANSIGVGATVITSDGYLVLPKRNRWVHFQCGSEGCSTSGALKWTDGLLDKFIEELKRQLSSREGPQEILLDPDKIVIHPLAFAREFERAGKPQFFFHIWTSRRLDEFKKRWKVSISVHEEFDSIRWIEMYEPRKLRAPDRAIDQAVERILALLRAETHI
jgi:hypothetical protein